MGGTPLEITVSDSGQAQVLHAVLDQLRELLSLGAAVHVEALLADALGAARGLAALAAQTPRPLHAFLA